MILTHLPDHVLKIYERHYTLLLMVQPGNKNLEEFRRQAHDEYERRKTIPQNKTKL